MAQVRHVLLYPQTGKPIVGKTVSFACSVPDAYVTAGPSQVTEYTAVPSDATGLIVVDLPPNDTLTPTGTAWIVTVGGGAPLTMAIIVPSTTPPNVDNSVNPPQRFWWLEDIRTIAPTPGAVVPFVAEVAQGAGIVVDNTDPTHPVVSADLLTVNHESPDGAGNVQLSASDVGADPAGSATSAATGALNSAKAYTDVESARAEAAEALLAPLTSPHLLGTPTAPTAPPGTNTTQVATAAFVAAAVASAVAGGMVYRAVYDASGNTFPSTGGSGAAGAIVKGNFWVCSVAGVLGGTPVSPGDMIIAQTDNPGQTAANWELIEHALGYAAENVANKTTDGTLAANSDTLYPSEKAVRTFATGAAAARMARGRVVLASANYAAVDGDIVAADTTGGTFTVTIPAAAGGAARIIVKWIKGTVAPTIQATGSDHFNTATGAQSFSPTYLNQGYQIESDGVSLQVITADDFPMSAGDQRYVQQVNAAPLAQAGQTPSQLPVPPGTASVGALAVAARGDHVHGLGTLGRNMMFGGWPLAYNNNSGAGKGMSLLFDGTWAGGLVNDYDGFNGLGNIVLATLAGSVYTMNANRWSMHAVDFTLNAGITLKPGQVGGAVVIVASRSITINGTIDCSGANAVGAAGAAGTANGSYGYRGGAGASGGTGVGAAGSGSNNISGVAGGTGSAGGNSGATAGGAAGANNWALTSILGGQHLPFLIGKYGASTQSGVTDFPVTSNISAFGPCMGGTGGGAGAGDGTNAGGGAGQGGGVIILVAPSIVIGSTAVLKVNGGNGANGVAGNAGGGGAGGNGAMSIHGLSVSIDPAATFQANPGTPGNGSGTGNAGAAAVLNGPLDPPVTYGGFGKGMGYLIGVWQ